MAGVRPTCLPSFILIHSTVWPQYSNVTDRQTDCQTDSGLIAEGEPFYTRSPNDIGSPFYCHQVRWVGHKRRRTKCCSLDEGMMRRANACDLLAPKTFYVTSLVSSSALTCREVSYVLCTYIAAVMFPSSRSVVSVTKDLVI